jgi:anaerobic selenocysteine-containing dehydrogenase
MWNPGTLSPPLSAKAQAVPPFQSYGFGLPLTVRGLADTLAGPSTAALPDEILNESEHQVRALISAGGNPVAAWPDQLKVIEALDSLELLVQIDPWMSATARRAHYVIAPKLSLEMPAMTSLFDMLPAGAPGKGWPQPYGQYTPAIVDPPAGSDLICEWELFYGIAQRIGLQLQLRPIDMNGPTGTAYPVDMSVKPTDDDLFALLTRDARVPLDVVKQFPHGAIFPADIRVAAKDPGWVHRLNVGHPEMLADLAMVAGESSDDRASWASPAFPLRLISRRLHSRYNSGGHQLPKLLAKDPTNHAYMHPDDLAALDLAPGDVVEISSARATILGIVEADTTLLPGLVSMTHSFGDAPDRDDEVRTIGGPTCRLCDVDDAYDPYSGQPVMSNIPVAVLRHERAPVATARAT